MSEKPEEFFLNVILTQVNKNQPRHVVADPLFEPFIGQMQCSAFSSQNAPIYIPLN